MQTSSALFYKTIYLNEEVSCTEPSRSVSFSWLGQSILFCIFVSDEEKKVLEHSGLKMTRRISRNRPRTFPASLPMRRHPEEPGMNYLRLTKLVQGILKGEVSLYHWPPVWLFWNQLFQCAIFCVYLQNRVIQTSHRGGQWYSDTSLFSIPWLVQCHWLVLFGVE